MVCGKEVNKSEEYKQGNISSLTYLFVCSALFLLKDSSNILQSYLRLH
jgi:hypothetical protein